MDGGLGSAPSGQETLLGLADGGCGGSEVKLEGDAEKAADPAMREEFTSSSCFDGTSTTKKGKKRKSATPSTPTTSGLGSGPTTSGLGLGRPARMEADGSAGCNAKALKVVPWSNGFSNPLTHNCGSAGRVHSCLTRVQAVCCPLSIGAFKANLGPSNGPSAP